MGGSGSSGGYNIRPGEIEEIREQARERLERSRQNAEINTYLQSELASINDRDMDSIGRHLGALEEALSDDVQGFDRLLFGGSYAKHTYVDGLSDIDALVVIDSSSSAKEPEEVREELMTTLRRRLDMGEVDEISAGNLAVTVTFRDGSEVQLLPAIQRGDAHAISSADGSRWVSIRPKEFAERLTVVNREQGGGVVPAIKLAKAMVNSQLGDDAPSGYHIEALAIAAFADYEGARTPRAMVERLFDTARTNVLKPIGDVTGQSRHVDEALGDEGSEARRELGRRMGRIADVIQSATTTDEWKALLEQ